MFTSSLRQDTVKREKKTKIFPSFDESQGNVRNGNFPIGDFIKKENKDKRKREWKGLANDRSF